jgi:hypothetical protein
MIAPSMVELGLYNVTRRFEIEKKAIEKEGFLEKRSRKKSV